VGTAAREWEDRVPVISQVFTKTGDTGCMTLFALLGCLVIAGEIRYQLGQAALRRTQREQEYRLPF
jgi:hypothetical protein